MLSSGFSLIIMLLSLAFVLGGAGCASTGSPRYQVNFDQDVSVIGENDKLLNVPKGETVEMQREPIVVSRPNHKTLIILPIPEQGGVVKVRMPKETTKTGSSLDGSMEASIIANDAAQGIIAIQNLLVANQADEALSRLLKLRDRYPGFSYLRFLEASCYLVKGNLDKARELVEAALLDFPDDSVGRAFISQIKQFSANKSPEFKSKEGP